jgi:hypothetical protein
MYRKKPIVIEAVQLGWETWNEMCDFLGDIIGEENPGRYQSNDADKIELTIPTLEGDMVASHGDWIIKGVQGEFYPCKPEIFSATYEPV